MSKSKRATDGEKHNIFGKNAPEKKKGRGTGQGGSFTPLPRRCGDTDYGGSPCPPPPPPAKTSHSANRHMVGENNNNTGLRDWDAVQDGV